MPETLSYLERLWDQGQQHLAAGRYVSARQALEAAEVQAFRQREAASLARIYLPLLETRRQIRYNACDGPILICDANEKPAIHSFLQLSVGTIVVTGPNAAVRARSVFATAQRCHTFLESLVLATGKKESRLVTVNDPAFAAGIPVHRTLSDQAIPPTTSAKLDYYLPVKGLYEPQSTEHARLRETIILAWEALALRWQARHPLEIRPGQGWAEIIWLRRALLIDPACEPISMRIMTIAENLGRQS